MNGPLVIGVDVGGSNLSGVAVAGGGKGETVAQARRPLDGRSLDAQVVDLAHALAAQSNAAPAAVGVAVPGQVDQRHGVMRLAVNVDPGEVAIGPLVEHALGVPCRVEHDARAAALWLLEEGGDPGASLVYLSVGTGISAAVVHEGRVVRGMNGIAGEIGHMQAVEDGPPCSCGLSGCLEAVAAGPAIERLATEALARGESTLLSVGAVTAEHVYRATAAGDAVARHIASRIGIHLARAIRGLVLANGVDRVVIGGGLSRAGAAFLDPIVGELERERTVSALIRQAVSTASVQLLAPDIEAGALGAVVVARAALDGPESGTSQGMEVGARG
jgi:glucokinase